MRGSKLTGKLDFEERPVKRATVGSGSPFRTANFSYGSKVFSDDAPKIQIGLVDDDGSPRSALSNEIYWSDFLNLSFNTKIFSKNSEYMYELSNIFSAKEAIDKGMSEIIPNIHVYKRLAGHINVVFEGLDQLRVATKRCVQILEDTRKDMYKVTKKVMELKDKMTTSKTGAIEPTFSPNDIFESSFSRKTK